MAARFFIGPAGWSYADWAGTVYPPEIIRRRQQLPWLARQFDLVEINTSFYRIPSPAMTERWLRAVSDRPAFRFTVKLFQGITHAQRLDPAVVADCRNAIAPLHNEGRLGGLLLQFPWSFHCGRQEKIFLRRVLDAFEGFPLAVEVRHGSWNQDAFFDYLHSRAVMFCNIDQPIIGDSLELTARVTAPSAYLRLHGRNQADWFRPDAGVAQRYNYLYSEGEIAALAAIAEALGREADHVYIVTNNHYRGKAVVNALQLSRRLISGFSPAWEPDLGTIP